MDDWVGQSRVERYGDRGTQARMDRMGARLRMERILKTGNDVANSDATR